jgi:hypothetical protein
MKPGKLAGRYFALAAAGNPFFAGFLALVLPSLGFAAPFEPGLSPGACAPALAAASAASFASRSNLSRAVFSRSARCLARYSPMALEASRACSSFFLKFRSARSRASCEDVAEDANVAVLFCV